jgi:molybdopterin-binding protein
VAIRHEDIRVTREKPTAPNGFNVLKATLASIVPEGSSSLLDLQVDKISMNAVITHDAMNRLEAHRGDHLYALIRKAHVKIVPAG